MTRILLVLAALAVLVLSPASAGAHPSTFLHKSEAKLAQIRATYGQADRVGAFHVSLGACSRESRSRITCRSSLWRNDRYGVQLRCNYRVKVSKFARGHVTVTRWRTVGYCGAADPVVPQPKPAPKPRPAPRPSPGYPSYEQGSDYSPPSSQVARIKW